jgi:uncharacterized protein (TIGR04255 family)
MPFPIVDRVIFKTNPLIEVVCELTFVSPFDNMESPAWLDVHKCLAQYFPFFNKQKEVHLKVDAKESNTSVEQIESLFYELSSIDGQLKLFIRQNKISLITTNYTEHHNFFPIIDNVVEALEKNNLMGLIARVGNRYKDLIQRSLLNDDCRDASWADLIEGSIISPLNNEEIKNDVIGSQVQFLVKLDTVNDNAYLKANCGTVRRQDNNEECFSIDSDIFMEGRFDYASSKQFIKDANKQARYFFFWSTTKRLRSALQPSCD